MVIQAAAVKVIQMGLEKFLEAAVQELVQGQLAQFQLVPEPVAVGMVVGQDLISVVQGVGLAKGLQSQRLAGVKVQQGVV